MMTTTHTLTDEQVARYRAEGYVLLGPVLSGAQLEALREDEARFRTARAGGAPTTHFFSATARHSPVVREVILSDQLRDVARQLVGTDDVAFRYDQFVTKMPDGQTQRTEFPWHQDDGYTRVEPATGLTVWIALDDVDTENGCVWVMPRSHQGGVLPHGASGPNNFLETPVEGDGVPAILKAGEAVAFTGLTLHRSKYNRTDRARRAFFVTFTDAAATYQEQGMSEPRPVLNAPGAWMVSGRAPL